MVEPVAAAVIPVAAKKILGDVLDDTFKKGKYAILTTVRNKLYMEEARNDTITGLQENLKSEVKVWAGIGWEADKCPVVGLGRGRITDQADVEALAASSISINDQAILDGGSEELRGRTGFSLLVLSKLQDSPLLIHPKEAENLLRQNAKECLTYRVRLELWHSQSRIKRIHKPVMRYVPENDLVATEVAEAVMRNTVDRHRRLQHSTRSISQEERDEGKNTKTDALQRFEEELEQKKVARLVELDFDTRMETLTPSLTTSPLSVSQYPEDLGQSTSQIKDMELNLNSDDISLEFALASAASEQGIRVTHEGISRIIQSEISVNAGGVVGPVRLIVAKDNGAWQFNGLLSESDMQVLNLETNCFRRTAKRRWYPSSEKRAVSAACAIGACLSSSFLLTYEDRTDLKMFTRMHLVVSDAGGIQALVIARKTGLELHLRMNGVTLKESEEEIFEDFLVEKENCSMEFGLFRSWCTISAAAAGSDFGSDFAFNRVTRYLDRPGRQEFSHFLKKIASGEFSRIQREEASKELYFDVEEGLRTTHCDWLDSLVRNWATSKMSIRIRVALTLKREEIAAVLGLQVQVKPPETDWDVITARMRKLKRDLTKMVRKNKFLGERGSIVSLSNSLKERTFCTTNRFRRYVDKKFVVHVSGKNVIVVEKEGESRRATWLPCQQQGIEATFTSNRIGELSDKAALALVVFGQRHNFTDPVMHDELIRTENGDLKLERAMLEIVKKATELYTSSTEMARAVIRFAHEEISLSINDMDMIKRFIMVAAYAEGAGIVETGGWWKDLLPDAKATRGGISFKIDYKMPSAMLHGDGEWVVVGNRAYETVQGSSSNERIVKTTNFREVSRLSECFWPGGLVLDSWRPGLAEDLETDGQRPVMAEPQLPSKPKRNRKARETGIGWANALKKIGKIGERRRRNEGSEV